MSAIATNASLRAQCKAAGMSSSGNKTALTQRLAKSSSASTTGSVCATTTPKSGSAPVRLNVQFDAKTCANLGLKLVAVSTDASGNPEYIYNKAASSSAAASKSTTKLSTPISKKVTTSKGDCLLGKASDKAFEEAIDVFKARLEDKKVPMKKCQEFLAYFCDAKDIPKHKAGVYEELALQTHYETDSDDDDEEEECESGDDDDDN